MTTAFELLCPYHSLFHLHCPHSRLLHHTPRLGGYSGHWGRWSSSLYMWDMLQVKRRIWTHRKDHRVIDSYILVKMSGIRQTVGFDRKMEATYCSLAHHFGLHSHRHGHRHSVEEHTPRYDIGTGLYCSAVLKKTHQKKEKKTLVITSCCWWHCIHTTWIWLLTAIGLIRAIAAVKYMVTSLGQVVAGPISTPQLCTLGVI